MTRRQNLGRVPLPSAAALIAIAEAIGRNSPSIARITRELVVAELASDDVDGDEEFRRRFGRSGHCSPLGRWTAAAASRRSRVSSASCPTDATGPPPLRRRASSPTGAESVVVGLGDRGGDAAPAGLHVAEVRLAVVGPGGQDVKAEPGRPQYQLQRCVDRLTGLTETVHWQRLETVAHCPDSWRSDNAVSS
jgi:hypothetical protein